MLYLPHEAKNRRSCSIFVGSQTTAAHGTQQAFSRTVDGKAGRRCDAGSVRFVCRAGKTTRSDRVFAARRTSNSTCPLISAMRSLKLSRLKRMGYLRRLAQLAPEG